MINFFEERLNWFLWIPVLFGIGICCYFALPEEPSIWIGINWVVFSSALLILIGFRKHTFVLLLAAISLIIALGFTNAKVRAIRQASPVIPKIYQALSVTGIISDVDIQPSGYRIILQPLSIDKITPTQLPKYIRLIVRTPLNGANPGDTVKTLAILDPPPMPAYPNAYDFARIAYFQQIGGVGYTIAPIEIIKPAENFSFTTYIATLRKTIADRIIDDIGKENGSIATALLVGESGAIAKKTFADIRTSGLAHLLSISGLHLSLVVGIFYVFSRKLFALSETLTLRYNIKKWAAICGLVGSACYLLLAGMPIPAQRAYIMASLVLFAILIDRNPTPMRCIAWAALIILVLEPESILTPSFQMSFAAVVALISGYRALSNLFSYWSDTLPEHKRHFLARAGIYTYGIVISTIIAGLATLPFGIYHFNNYSSYSILANLVAIPATSFWIMPWGVVALLLFPFHLESLALYPMQWGIELITFTAYKVANLPNASGFVPSLPTYGFVLITFGMCWLLLWERKWRLAGIPIIALGALSIMFTTTPDIIIDQKGTVFAVKNSEGKLVFNDNRLAHYTRHLWMQRAGQKNTIPSTERMGLTCDVYQCTYETNQHNVSFVKDATALHEACNNADVVVNLTWTNTPCRSPHYTISRRNLYYQGTHLIWLEDNGKVTTQTVNGERGKRLWVNSSYVVKKTADATY